MFRTCLKFFSNEKKRKFTNDIIVQLAVDRYAAIKHGYEYLSQVKMVFSGGNELASLRRISTFQ